MKSRRHRAIWWSMAEEKKRHRVTYSYAEAEKDFDIWKRIEWQRDTVYKKVVKAISNMQKIMMAIQEKVETNEWRKWT